MLVPLGYYLLIEGEPKYLASFCGSLTILGGLVLFWVVWFKGNQAEKKERKKSDDKFNAMLREIRGLRKDMNNILRQDKDGRSEPK